MLGPEIVAYLAAEGLGTVDVNLFAVPFPHDAPDVAVCVVEHEGRSIGTFGDSLSAEALQDAEFQVIVRGARDAAGTARTKADAIRDKLNRLGPVTLSGKRYLNVTASTSYWIRWDDEGRALWGIRCRTDKE